MTSETKRQEAEDWRFEEAERLLVREETLQARRERRETRDSGRDQR